MGNDLKTGNQILLLGPKGHGKTLFLYTNVLKNPKENISNVIDPSISYNYEVISIREEKFGFWDLPGSPFFKKLWKHFYRNIPLIGVVYMVLIKSEDDNIPQEAAENETENKKLDPILEARKNLHFVLNEPELKNAFVLVVFNDRSDAPLEDRLAKKAEYEKKIKFKKIQNEMKESVILNASQFSEYEEFIEKLVNLSSKAQKSKKDNKDKDEKEKSSHGDDEK